MVFTDEQKRTLIISGKQGSGKTSTSDLLLAQLSSQFNIKTFKFAGPLYEMHDAVLPICKKYGIRPEDMKKDGDLLQILGTEYGRNKIRENVWVNIAKNLISTHLAEGPQNLAMIDDCRFENEFDFMQSSALTVRLTCPREVRKARIEAGGGFWRENDTHPSEVGLDRYDEEGRFELYVKTDEVSVEEAAKIIKETWLR